MTEKPSYRLEELSFDGPLDLLLRLIEKNKYDIFDIPITELLRQYQAYVEALPAGDLEVLSDFLLMATTLLDIKTRMLLPKENAEEEEEEGDPREELVERLLLYKKYRYLAGELKDLSRYAERYGYREELYPEEVRGYKAPPDTGGLLNNVTPESLLSVFEACIRRKDYRLDSVRKDFGVIKKERVSLSGKIRHLVRFARQKRSFSFRELCAEGCSKTEIVVSFLALLELMKMGRVKASQAPGQSDILFEAGENIDTDDLDLRDIVDE